MFSKMVTSLRVDLVQFRKDLAEAQKLAAQQTRLIEQAMRVRPGIGGGGVAGLTGGRLSTIGGGGRTASQQMREEVRDQLASFAQIRKFRKELSDQEAQDGRTRRAQSAAEFREQQQRRQAELRGLRADIQARAQEEARQSTVRRAQAQREAREVDARRAAELRALRGDIQARAREEARLDQIRRQAERRRTQEARQAAQEAARAEGFMTGGAQQGVRNNEFLRRERARAQREADAQAAREAAAQRQAQRDSERRNIRQNLLSVAAGRSVRIDRPGGGFGAGGRGGIPTGGDIDAVTAKIRGGLTSALQRASNAAQQLNLLVGVSIFGGLGALVAEGFRLNSQLEQVNLTMAATLATTNEVVNSQGKLVDGPTKANFLLRGTAGIYQQVRKEAAETILEQQELLETVAENLSLAQKAGFKLDKLAPAQTKEVVKAVSGISQLAKAVGLPGGQRQLSQEVRALFTGERLQGATVARLLGFSSIKTIQDLQDKPGKRPGTTAFIDELNKRFARAQPILDKFKDTAAGIFTTLISQGRLFLQIFSESAFKAVVGSAKELRNFLTDERISETAKNLGESFGNFARSAIEFAKALAPIGRFFGFLVQNAATITGVLLAFKGLQFVQNLRGVGGIGGAGGLAGFLGGSLGTRAAGGIGAGAAGFGAGAVGPIRGAGIEFASAAGAFGLGGALSRQRGLASQALGSRIGRGGLGFLAPAAGLFGFTPATAVLAAGLLGAGIGTGANALGNRFINSGIRPAPQQVDAERAGRVQSVITAQRQRAAALERARALEQRGRVGLQGEFEPNLFQRFAFGTREAPELTSRVTSQGLRAAAEQRRQQMDARRLQLRLDQDLKLQEQKDRNSEERIKAQLALAQVRRDKEAEINLRSQLDAIAARQEFKDAEARALKLKAIEQGRLRDLRELRQDEAQQSRETALQALGDEEGAARTRAQRTRTEIERQFRGREQTPEIRRLQQQALATAALTAQKEILGARVNRFSQRAAFAGQLAGVEGRSLGQIRAGVFGDIAGAAQQRIEGRITNQEFDRFVTARKIRGLEDERKKRREVINEGISLTNQFTDTVIRATDLARDHWLGLLQLRERISDRERALNKARKDEQRAIVQALREEKEAREDLRNFLATKGQQGAVRDILRSQTGVQGEGFGAVLPSGEERIRRQIRDRFGRTAEGRQLTGEQRAEAVDQQTQTFVRGLADVLVSPEGLGGVAAKLQEIGLKLTDVFSRAQIGQLQTVAGEGGQTRALVQRQGETREQFAARQRVEEAGRSVGEAREQRADTERQDVRARRDERIQAIQIEQDFNRGKAQLALDFSNLAVASREFLVEAQRASIGLGGLTAALVAATGVKVPSPEALAVQNARQAVAADQKGAGTTIVKPALPTSTGGVTRDGATNNGRRSDAGTIINIDLGGLKIGTDTEETIKKLGVQLERDARRTPVS